MNGQPLSFGGNSLQTANIGTKTIDHESGSVRQATVYPVAHANTNAIPYVGYTGKDVVLEGWLHATDLIAMDMLLDQFRGYFNGRDKNLDIAYAGKVRRYVGTSEAPVIIRAGGLLSATFHVLIHCQPFGQDITPTTVLAQQGRTLATYSDTVTFLGSAEYQLPIRTIAYSSISGGTNGTVNFGNNANGQQISLTRNWTSGDVWAVDTIKKQVFVNGTSVDFVGAFPEFPPGTQSMAYSDNFTSRTFNDNVIQYPMWA
jgi:hypothetical protein